MVWAYHHLWKPHLPKATITIFDNQETHWLSFICSTFDMQPSNDIQNKLPAPIVEISRLYVEWYLHEGQPFSILGQWSCGLQDPVKKRAQLSNKRHPI